MNLLTIFPFMKKIILTICTIVFGLFVFAQQNLKQGEIVYEETIKLNIKIEGMSEDMLNRMPKERKFLKLLYFNEEASSYQASKEEAESQVPGSASSGGMFAVRMASANQADIKVYFNFKNELKIEQRSFMTRMFLIQEKFSKAPWKFTGNQKMILDYPCQEASLITENDTILAWFTPNIPVSTGPATHVGLPGLILEVNINNGNRIITAKKIDLKPIDDELISKPNKGKKVTQEEFDKIVEEKRKEMGIENRGMGGTQVIIRGQR